MAKKLAGFSIGEVLLAAFVLTSGLMATSALMATSLRNSFETRDAIIATQLAQEGVELVRNVRDNDFANGGDGFDDFSNEKHCRIDYEPTDLDCVSTAPPSNMVSYHLQYSSGFYRHGGSGEKFSRYIYIDYDDTAGEKKALVRSFVYWGDGTGGTFAIGDVGGNGNSAQCTAAKKCVYTEVTLTSWSNL